MSEHKEERKELYKAIAGFQSEVPIIHRDTKGYGYTYADLTKIITEITPLLKVYNLGYSQPMEGNSVRTILFHTESGQSIESYLHIPQGVTMKGMNEFQVMGSAITYLRRYGLASILGLVTDADLDACTPQQPQEKKKEPTKSKAKPEQKKQPSAIDRVNALKAQKITKGTKDDAWSNAVKLYATLEADKKISEVSTPLAEYVALVTEGQIISDMNNAELEEVKANICDLFIKHKLNKA